MLWPQRLSEMTHRRRGLWAVLSLLVVAWMAIAPSLPDLSAQLPAPQATATRKVVTEAPRVVTEAPRVVTATPRPAPTKAQPAATARPNRSNIIRQNLSIAGDLVLESALAWDDDSITIIEETRVGLVRVDEVTGEPHPGLATSWSVSGDGKTYAFFLRQDIPWVRWNTLKREVEVVKDCRGNPRMVTAPDFEFGILHTIAYRENDPGYGYVLAQAIQGGTDYHYGSNPDARDVAVHSIDNSTLQITFEETGVFNASAVSPWLAMAAPAWLIEGDACNPALGDRWAEPSNLQTYGPFAVADWIKSMSLTLVPNPHWPGDEWTPNPQAEKIVFDMFDMERALTAFESGTLDSVLVPSTQMQRVRNDPQLSALLTVQPSPCSYSFAFNTQARFVDDVRLRRALSMAIDRQKVVDGLTDWSFEPAQWFTRPGVWGAPAAEEYRGSGIGYNPDEARRLLDEYLGEKGLTPSDLGLRITVSQSTFTQLIALALQEQWAQELGLQIEMDIIADATEYSTRTQGPDAPQIWRAAWCADYTDAAGFVPQAFVPGKLFNRIDPAGGLHWQNDAVDALARMAATTSDTQSRKGMYAQIEYFLVNDDAAIIPVFWYTNPSLTQPWIQRTFSNSRHERYEKWSVGP